MALEDWPQSDRRWAARYILCLAKAGVSLDASNDRQAELIGSVEASGTSATELFGDPDELAVADAPLLDASETSAAAAESLGARDILAAAGGLLVVQGIIAGVVLLVTGGGPVDVRVGPLVGLLGIVACEVLGMAAIAYFTAGRMRAAAGMAAAAVAVLMASAAILTASGGGAVLVAGVPRWGIALALLVPGGLVYALSRCLSERTPQTDWSDEQWFDRFRGTLRAQGVSADVAREHERSLRADLTESAVGEYGQPGALARRLASDDTSATSRRVWWSTAGWLALALFVGISAIGESGIALAARIALVLGLLLIAVGTGGRAWQTRSKKVAA
ncbi:hypothetical protein [Tsukamurella strandjordii]|uniref:Uncharacterized protein n=1 Tax=Tsukamurella strandjordii TaxID=147577 RepID=A0AA90ND21_9ACTN|nr:hypothetical protein [Tsukamurella strandjordii]MDP0396958.1 hypothetical protein [Tsukamurella strandjordii]